MSRSQSGLASSFKIGRWSARASSWQKAIGGLLLLLSPMGLSGCATFGYLLQAGKGQMAMLNRAKPLQEVIGDEKTPPRIRQLLGEIPAMKSFGEANGIKPTRNYTEYVKLDRPAASWVVSACEPLRFKSKEWSFPIVGAFPYLGWFDLDGAKKHAEELKSEGWDVDLRGAGAFSTLGWFRDPVVSSMISQGDQALGDLANVILHESVHATLYIYGQAYFNESVASFVADRLTYDFLEKRVGKSAAEYRAYEESERKTELRQRRLHATYVELDRLYASNIPDSEKLSKKASVLAKVKEELGLSREINNATLVQYKTYATGGVEFEGVLKTCGGDWKRFLGTLLKLKESDFSKTQQEDLKPLLDGVAARGC